MATEAKEKYIEGIGRRKRAVARVRITPSSQQSITVNDQKLAEYFPTKELHVMVESPFGVIELGQKFNITVKVSGGGIQSQAESVRHGIARALNEYDEDLRSPLKKAGYLKRDSRTKDRKKFGLKKARKRAQWSKR